MKHISISAIQFDSTTQVRAEISDAVVSEYAERMQVGDKFPPADLFEDGDAFFIGDGWHRLLAAQKNGDVTFPSNVVKGGRRDAVKFALGANAKHGMPRTNADKRKSVEVALRELGGLSDREVAKVCAVSNDFVGRVRRELSSDDSSTEARLGADGKIRKLPAIRHEPRGEAEQKAKEEAPPVGGSLADIEADAKPKRQRSAPFVMPDRGMFIARGAIVQLQQILPADGERIEALKAVRDWCNQQLNSP